MATFTPNNSLKKPDGGNYVLISDLNGNMDILDSVIGNPSDSQSTDKRNLIAMINEARLTGASPPPYFNTETETWWQWDASLLQYVDTGRPASAMVDVESTTTLPPGSDATVENVGTPLDVQLRFGIPVGDTGAQGERGPRGETGAGLALLGHFDTLAELQAARPVGNPGDMFSVGIAVPRDMYQWSESAGAWVNEGPIGGGSGTVKSVNGVDPDEAGNIPLTAAEIPLDPTAPEDARQTVKEAIDATNAILTSPKPGEFMTTKIVDGEKVAAARAVTSIDVQYENASLPAGTEANAGAALDAILAMRGAANGLATLDARSLIPSAQFMRSGTWTPNFTGLTSGSITKTPDTVGYWHLIGDLVYVSFKIGVTSVSSPVGVQTRLSGLPFPTTFAAVEMGQVRGTTMDIAYNGMLCMANIANGTELAIKHGDVSSYGDFPYATWAKAGAYLSGGLLYRGSNTNV